MHDTFWQFVLAHQSELILKLWQQLYLVAFSMFLAVIIGMSIALWVVRYTSLRLVILNVANILQTIPSLALFAFLLPFVGIGAKPAIIALTLYALLPVMRSTVTGIQQIAPENIEAANALGLSRFQRLRLIELPLAMPVIFNGIRIATVICVGIATLATFIGAGGLGDFINQGLAMDNVRLVLLGAIPAALMAFVIDGGMALYEKRLRNKRRKKIKIVWGVLLLVVLMLIGGVMSFQVPSKSKSVIRIASKKFTEQYILAEIMGQLIEAKTHLRVIQKQNLGSTQICVEALAQGDIDLYPDYTGTLYLTTLHQTKILSPSATYHYVKRAFAQKGLMVLPGFGFDNSSGLAVTQAFAKRYQLKDISDLVPIEKNLILAAMPAFLQRADGAPGLLRVYGLKFGEIKEMNDSLKYQALLLNDVNIANIFTTDGHIHAYHLKVLKDNKRLFPPFDAVPVVRIDFYKAHPKLQKVLSLLHGLINNKEMQNLNYQVDILGKSPKQVACEFLNSKRLISHADCH